MATDAKEPFVSVVIPVFNRENLIGRALDSIFAQEDPPAYEVVVVNDGSTDGTMEVLRGYGDRVRVIDQKNAGVSRARNRGIVEAKGQWVYFLDSDDVALPRTLRTLADVAATDAELTVVYGDFSTLTPQGRVIPYTKKVYAQGARPIEATFRECALGMGSALIRREAMIRAGLFDTSFRLAEDYEFWARLAIDAKFAHVPQQMFVCYKHDQQASTARPMHILGHYKAQQKLLRLYKEKGVELPEAVRREAVNDYLAFHARKLYWQRRGASVTPLLWRAALANPTKLKLWLYWALNHLPAGFFRVIDR